MDYFGGCQGVVIWCQEASLASLDTSWRLSADLENSTFQRDYGVSARRAGRQWSVTARSGSDESRTGYSIGSGGCSGSGGSSSSWVYGHTSDTVFIIERGTVGAILARLRLAITILNPNLRAWWLPPRTRWVLVGRLWVPPLITPQTQEQSFITRNIHAKL